MKLTCIAAIGKNRELGIHNGMIWHLPSDLKFFRKQTQNHVIVMGRKTFESLPGMLPKRHHIVISSSSPTLPEEVEVLKSVDEFLEKYKDFEDEIYCIGGGMIYTELLPYAQKLVLTEIDASAEATVFFPTFNKDLYTREIISDIIENDVHYQHVIYTKK